MQPTQSRGTCTLVKFASVVSLSPTGISLHALDLLESLSQSLFAAVKFFRALLSSSWIFLLWETRDDTVTCISLNRNRDCKIAEDQIHHQIKLIFSCKHDKIKDKNQKQIKLNV